MFIIILMLWCTMMGIGIGSGLEYFYLKYQKKCNIP